MKILYVGTTTTVEYMADSILHGLRSVLGNNVIDAIKINHMYTDYTGDLNTMHGKGFTLSKTLVDDIDRTDIPTKILSKYFDYVIYGASQRSDSLQYLDLVREVYPANKIVFINGADSWRGIVEPELLNIPGIHFLREKLTNSSVYPISFSIPKNKIVESIPEKSYYLMPLVPGVESTYIYKTQDEYYGMYQKSLFGLTWKKAGWDCLRHYEILSQGCLPLFLDIAHLPTTVMTTYPRKKIEQLLNVAVSIDNFKKDMDFHYDERITISNVDFSSINFTNPETYGYLDIANELLDYTKTHLTTEYQAEYILSIIQSL
jgi:hypothetical protein